VVADASYAVCLRLAREHYENFPVASRLVPAPVRPHIAAVYAFARIADDFSDEGERSDAARLALLDDWRARLASAVEGRVVGDGSDAAHIFTALGETMRTCDLPPALFEDLLSAFRQDVIVKRYETWEDLIDYCRRSANPVGRLVLRISGYRDAELDARSDDVCTALQLTNFWQDVGRDWDKRRVYVPQAIVREAGADEADLERRRVTDAWRAALADVTGRTRRLFLRGRSVTDGVRGRLAWELRATWLGGTRILDRTEAAGFDVFDRRPALGWVDALPIGWRMLTWRRGARS
jgi:hydroxysqualene synthase